MNFDYNQTYQQELWTMTKDSIYDAIHALQMAIENTQELLIIYDDDCGRSTRSTKLNAERLEQEIEQMNKALIGIQKPNGKE